MRRPGRVRNPYFYVTFVQELVGLEQITPNRVAAFETYVWHMCQGAVFPGQVFEEQQDCSNGCCYSVVPE